MKKEKKNNQKAKPALSPEEIKARKRIIWTRILRVLHIMLILISVSSFCAGIYVKKTYPNEHLEQMLFYMFNGSKSDTAAWDAAFTIGSAVLLFIGILIVIQFVIIPKAEKKADGKNRTVYSLLHNSWIVSVVLCAVLLGFGLWNCKLVEYMYMQSVHSDFIEDNYVRPQDVAMKAPEQKRNLLIIEIESFETTMFLKEQGGVWDHEVIPEMYSLLFDEDSIFFASNDKAKGTLNSFGTTWTTAGVIANTSGVPFKVPAEQNNSYKEENFMRGAYTLGDVLKDNGYHNVLITCSRSSFGGIKEYFTRHGQYDIIDINSYDQYGLTLPDSNINEWGFSDEAGIHMAADMMTKLNEEGQPWHLFLSTIDTHFNGYMYDPDEKNGYIGSVTKFSRQLDNVYATASRNVAGLVEWLKQQPFYEDTTIVIYGDHVNMMGTYCDRKDDSERARYNCIINAVATTEHTKMRQFTAYDFYPTTLAAIGFEIPGDKLGLGVNLFSDTKTLTEEYGFNYVDKQLCLRSEYYIDELIGRDHYEWLEKKSKDEGN